MESNPGPTTAEVAHEFHPHFRVYKDGRIERLSDDIDYVPPSEDPKTGVKSKDVVISPEVSARVFLPKTTPSDQKFPIIIYIHGGAFVSGSAFSSVYHNYVSSLAAEAKVIAVSVEYRLAPEFKILDCYDDAWTALKWVASHTDASQGPEPWITDHADFTRVFLAGDSAGANISHNVVARASVDGGVVKNGARIVGIVLVDPYFGDGSPEVIWTFLGPGTGCDDPRLFPMSDLNLLSKLICSKILVCTSEKDRLRERGWLYYEALKKSDWGGEVEIIETKGQGHCFHLVNPTCEDATLLMKQITSFIN